MPLYKSAPTAEPLTEDLPVMLTLLSYAFPFPDSTEAPTTEPPTEDLPVMLTLLS